jgi:homospermidine synthase
MNIVQIGCGAVGQCLNELFGLENVKIKKLIIIEPNDLPSWVKCSKHIKVKLTEDNIEKVLKPLVNKDVFVVDVSVDVDCIPIMELCKKVRAKYINTSLEDWNDDTDPSKIDVDNKKEMHERVLFYRMNKAKKVLEGAKSALLVDNGQNPGLVSSYFRYALEEVARMNKDRKSLNMIKKQEFNKASKRMGLEVVHISELDTQQPSIKLDPDTFYNTWSCVGFQSESLDPCSIGYGSCENNKNHQWIKPTDAKDPVVRFMDKRGCDVVKKSYCVDHDKKVHPIEGFCIPHGESYTIAKFLQYKSYRPSVYYVYCCSPIATESIEKLKERDYKPFEKNHVLELSEIKSGSDSVGTLLFFSGKGTIPKIAHWYGSSLSIPEAKKLGFKHGGPTTIQVAISLLTAIKYIESKHSENKLMTPENLDYKYMLAHSKKYLGKLISKSFEYSESSPLSFNKFA